DCPGPTCVVVLKSAALESAVRKSAALESAAAQTRLHVRTREAPATQREQHHRQRAPPFVY
ncbi:hypothetical protein, partial [Actinotignum sp. GS-2025b]